MSQRTYHVASYRGPEGVEHVRVLAEFDARSAPSWPTRSRLNVLCDEMLYLPFPHSFQVDVDPRDPRCEYGRQPYP